MFGKKDNKPAPDFQIFTIYDSKLESFDVPVFAVNQHDLCRQLINMFKDPQQSKNKFLTNAEDYSIFKIGSFDKKPGKLDAQNIEHIVNMLELRAAAQDQGIVST